MCGTCVRVPQARIHLVVDHVLRHEPRSNSAEHAKHGGADVYHGRGEQAVTFLTCLKRRPEQVYRYCCRGPWSARTYDVRRLNREICPSNRQEKDDTQKRARVVRPLARPSRSYARSDQDIRQAKKGEHATPASHSTRLRRHKALLSYHLLLQGSKRRGLPAPKQHAEAPLRMSAMMHAALPTLWTAYYTGATYRHA